MARLSRYAVPGQPHHVIQRGNNRSAILRVAQDYQFIVPVSRLLPPRMDARGGHCGFKDILARLVLMLSSLRLGAPDVCLRLGCESRNVPFGVNDLSSDLWCSES